MQDNMDVCLIGVTQYIVTPQKDRACIYNGRTDCLHQSFDHGSAILQVHFCKLTCHLIVVTSDSVILYVCNRGSNNGLVSIIPNWEYSSKHTFVGTLATAAITFSYPLCCFNFFGSIIIYHILNKTTVSYLKEDEISSTYNKETTRAFDNAQLSPNGTYLSAIESDSEESDINPQFMQNIFRLYLFYLPREQFIYKEHQNMDAGYLFFSKMPTVSNSQQNDIINESDKLNSIKAESSKSTEFVAVDSMTSGSSIESALSCHCLSTVVDMGRYRLVSYRWRVASQYPPRRNAKSGMEHVHPMVELLLTLDISGKLKIWSVSLAEPTDDFLGSGSFNISKDGSFTLEVNLLSSITLASIVKGFGDHATCASLARLSWVLAPSTMSNYKHARSKTDRSQVALSELSTNLPQTGSESSSSSSATSTTSTTAIETFTFSGGKVVDSKISSSSELGVALGWIAVIFPTLEMRIDQEHGADGVVNPVASNTTTSSSSSTSMRSLTPPRRHNSYNAHLSANSFGYDAGGIAITNKQKIRDRDSMIESRVTVDAQLLTAKYEVRLLQMADNGFVRECAEGVLTSVGLPTFNQFHKQSLKSHEVLPSPHRSSVHDHLSPTRETATAAAAAAAVYPGLHPWNIVLDLHAVCRFPTSKVGSTSEVFSVPCEVDFICQFGDLDISSSGNASMASIQKQYSGGPRFVNIDTGKMIASEDAPTTIVKSPFFGLPSRRLIRNMRTMVIDNILNQHADVPHPVTGLKLYQKGCSDLVSEFDCQDYFDLSRASGYRVVRWDKNGHIYRICLLPTPSPIATVITSNNAYASITSSKSRSSRDMIKNPWISNSQDLGRVCIDDYQPASERPKGSMSAASRRGDGNNTTPIKSISTTEMESSRLMKSLVFTGNQLISDDSMAINATTINNDLYLLMLLKLTNDRFQLVLYRRQQHPLASSNAMQDQHFGLELTPPRLNRNINLHAKKSNENDKCHMPQDREYSYSLRPDPQFGLGMKIDFVGGNVVVTGFKRHPDNNNVLEAERAGQIMIGDCIVGVGDKSLLESKSLSEALQIIRTAVRELNANSQAGNDSANNDNSGTQIVLKMLRKCSPGVNRCNDGGASIAPHTPTHRDSYTTTRRRPPHLLSHVPAEIEEEYLWELSGKLLLPLGTITVDILLSAYGRIIVSSMRQQSAINTANDISMKQKFQSLDDIFSALDKELAGDSIKDAPLIPAPAKKTKIEVMPKPEYCVFELILRQFSRKYQNGAIRRPSSFNSSLISSENNNEEHDRKQTSGLQEIGSNYQDAVDVHNVTMIPNSFNNIGMVLQKRVDIDMVFDNSVDLRARGLCIQLWQGARPFATDITARKQVTTHLAGEEITSTLTHSDSSSNSKIDVYFHPIEILSRYNSTHRPSELWQLIATRELDKRNHLQVNVPTCIQNQLKKSPDCNSSMNNESVLWKLDEIPSVIRGLTLVPLMIPNKSDGNFNNSSVDNNSSIVVSLPPDTEFIAIDPSISFASRCNHTDCLDCYPVNCDGNNVIPVDIKSDPVIGVFSFRLDHPDSVCIQNPFQSIAIFASNSCDAAMIVFNLICNVDWQQAIRSCKFDQLIHRLKTTLPTFQQSSPTAVDSSPSVGGEASIHVAVQELHQLCVAMVQLVGLTTKEYTRGSSSPDQVNHSNVECLKLVRVFRALIITIDTVTRKNEARPMPSSPVDSSDNRNSLESLLLDIAESATSPMPVSSPTHGTRTTDTSCLQVLFMSSLLVLSSFPDDMFCEQVLRDYDVSDWILQHKEKERSLAASMSILHLSEYAIASPKRMQHLDGSYFCTPSPSFDLDGISERQLRYEKKKEKSINCKLFLPYSVVLFLLNVPESSQNVIFEVLCSQPVSKLIDSVNHWNSSRDDHSLDSQHAASHDLDVSCLHHHIFLNLTDIHSVLISDVSCDHPSNSSSSELDPQVVVPANGKSQKYGLDILELVCLLRVPLWMRNLTVVETQIESVAMETFKRRKSAMEVFLELIIAGKEDKLLNLAKIDRSKSGAQLLSLLAINAASVAGKNAIRKNAFALMRMSNYKEAAATFLLASPPMLKEATSIMSKQLNNPLLALLTCRIVEKRVFGGGLLPSGRILGPMARSMVLKFFRSDENTGNNSRLSTPNCDSPGVFANPIHIGDLLQTQNQIGFGPSSGALDTSMKALVADLWLQDLNSTRLSIISSLTMISCNQCIRGLLADAVSFFGILHVSISLANQFIHSREITPILMQLMHSLKELRRPFELLQVLDMALCMEESHGRKHCHWFADHFQSFCRQVYLCWKSSKKTFAHNHSDLTNNNNNGNVSNNTSLCGNEMLAVTGNDVVDEDVMRAQAKLAAVTHMQQTAEHEQRQRDSNLNSFNALNASTIIDTANSLAASLYEGQPVKISKFQLHGTSEPKRSVEPVAVVVPNALDMLDVIPTRPGNGSTAKPKSKSQANPNPLPPGSEPANALDLFDYQPPARRRNPQPRLQTVREGPPTASNNSSIEPPNALDIFDFQPTRPCRKTVLPKAKEPSKDRDSASTETVEGPNKQGNAAVPDAIQSNTVEVTAAAMQKILEEVVPNTSYDTIASQIPTTNCKKGPISNENNIQLDNSASTQMAPGTIIIDSNMGTASNASPSHAIADEHITVLPKDIKDEATDDKKHSTLIAPIAVPAKPSRKPRSIAAKEQPSAENTFSATVSESAVVVESIPSAAILTPTAADTISSNSSYVADTIANTSDNPPSTIDTRSADNDGTMHRSPDQHHPHGAHLASKSSPNRSYLDQVVSFYATHNPSKLSSVPEILEKYKGREEELLTKLKRQYQVVET